MRSTVSFILILGCAATASAREEYKRDFRKSVVLPSGRGLRVESQFGRIGIRTQSKNEVAIQAVIRCSAGTADEAHRCADRIQVAVEENAGGVSVRTAYPQESGRRDLSYAVDYDIAMPDTAPLELWNRYGSADVSNLHASATIHSGNGSVSFLNGRGRQHIENTYGMVEVRKNEGDVTIGNSGGPTFATDIAGAIEITNRYGEIRVANAGRGVGIHSNDSNIQVSNAGGPVTISNTFGVVMVSDIRSDLTVQNESADITANGIAGKAELHNNGAAIKFSRIGKTLAVRATNSIVRGDTVGESATIETTYGSVDLSGVKGGARIATGNSPIHASGIGGELYAKTSFAAITIGDVGGPLTVEAQNSVVIVDAKSARRCQPVSIRTSYGPIRFTVPPGVGYNLTAHTTFGGIHTEPTVQTGAGGKIGEGELIGKIGGGGCELRLMDQNGSIDILR
jgi:DUF4097 and DUF4098 domain-containing protein YvlB